jgi:Uma2 family endonuclease
MAGPTNLTHPADTPPLRPSKGNIPILYEDDEEGEMGESSPHVQSDEIAHVCITAHLRNRPEYRVFSDMNLYYRPEGFTGNRIPYVSPDVMVVKPDRPLGEDVSSYQIGLDGPAPLLTAEILSERSAQQRDLGDKMTVYALLGVAEYILIDLTGRFLPQRLLLKRLQPDGTYQDVQDPDGGVSSRLGFRLVIDTDGKLRVLDTASGRRYIRPDEAETEAQARRQAEERIRALEADVARLRGSSAEEAPRA